MANTPKIEALPPDNWWPPEFDKASGNVLMEFPELIRSILQVGGRLFVTLESGRVIDCTDLLGEAKQ